MPAGAPSFFASAFAAALPSFTEYACIRFCSALLRPFPVVAIDWSQVEVAVFVATLAVVIRLTPNNN